MQCYAELQLQYKIAQAKWRMQIVKTRLYKIPYVYVSFEVGSSSPVQAILQARVKCSSEWKLHGSTERPICLHNAVTVYKGAASYLKGSPRVAYEASHSHYSPDMVSQPA